MMPYAYEPRSGPGRLPKHKWRKDCAGVFAERNGPPVGMCPAGLDPGKRHALLNEGIPYYPDKSPLDHPHSIFNVHDGVPYRAVRTNAGLSYHGFPCVSAKRDVPPRIMRLLLARASEKGCRSEVERWFEQYPYGSSNIHKDLPRTNILRCALMGLMVFEDFLPCPAP